MSWMTLRRASGSGWIAIGYPLNTRVGDEDVLDPMPGLLQPDQPETELGDLVAHGVVGRLVLDLDPQHTSVRPDVQAVARERLAQPVPRVRAAARVLYLDGEHAGHLRELGGRRRAQQPPGVDHDDVVAGAFELAEQVRRDEHGDAELGADPADQCQ